MDFDFSDEQIQFRGQVRRLLDDVCPLMEVRKTLDGAQPYSNATWRALAEMGFQSAAVPQAYGGLGLGELELCVAAEEIGRALAPVPSLSSVYVCTEAIRLFGSHDQKQTWLPGLADGSLIGTWAAAESPGEVLPNRIETKFVGGELHGAKSPVLDGLVANLALVLALGASGEPELVICDLSGTGVAREAVDSIDPSRPLARVRFDGAKAQRLPVPDDGWQTYRDLMNRAAILLSFEQVGAADRALWMARDYALQRFAFGRPIGANQAIKHKLANVFVKNELGRVHAYYGAWALSTGSAELSMAAAGARVAALEASSFSAQENIQTHGGIGFTWQSDCQLFYRRARFLATAVGGVQAWNEQLVNALEQNNEHGRA